jgi:hypothetical protein
MEPVWALLIDMQLLRMALAPLLFLSACGPRVTGRCG